jgi:hypothetical protein
VGLGFELRVLHLLSKQAQYCLSHTSSPYFIFWEKVLQCSLGCSQSSAPSDLTSSAGIKGILTIPASPPFRTPLYWILNPCIFLYWLKFICNLQINTLACYGTFKVIQGHEVSVHMPVPSWGQTSSHTIKSTLFQPAATISQWLWLLLVIWLCKMTLKSWVTILSIRGCDRP